VTSRQSAILKDLCDFCHCYLLNPLKPSGHFADHQARGCSTNTEPVRWGTTPFQLSATAALHIWRPCPMSTLGEMRFWDSTLVS
jgi:hypothetical protein